MTERTASCSCGQLRLACEGEPVRISICHCLECQKRTCSVFAMQARLSLELVRLKDDVPICVSIDQLGVRDPQSDSLLGFLREMEFASLTKRIAEGLGKEAPPPVDRPEMPAKSFSGRQPDGGASKSGGKGDVPAESTPQMAAANALRQAKAEKIDRSRYQTVTDMAALETWISRARAKAWRRGSSMWS